MRRLSAIAAILAAAAALPGGAAAQEPPSGVYVSHTPACEWLEDEGEAAFANHEFLALVPDRGIFGYEYYCHFYDVRSRPGNALQSVATVCDTPDYAFPDNLAIRPRDPQTLEVTSFFEAVLTANDPMSTGGTRLYYRCENLQELPLD